MRGATWSSERSERNEDLLLGMVSTGKDKLNVRKVGNTILLVQFPWSKTSSPEKTSLDKWCRLVENQKSHALKIDRSS